MKRAPGRDDRPGRGRIVRRARLELGEVYRAWGPSVRRGQLRSEAGSRAVLVKLGPKGADDAAVAAAREAAAPWLAGGASGVLPLQAVSRSGDRVIWVFTAVEALSLAHLVGEGPRRPPGLRAAVELACAVAERAMSVPEGARRGITEVDDVLVGPAGELWLAGHVGPPQGQERSAPGAGDGDASTVYGVGVLLAGLLGASAPPVSQTAHATWLRRVQVRAGSGAGAAQLVDWLGVLLAWNPAERPPLATLPARLGELVAGMPGERLADWAPVAVPAALASLADLASQADEETSGAGRVADLSDPGNLERPTLPAEAVERPTPLDGSALRGTLRMDPVRDAPTLGKPPAASSVARPEPVARRGSMPLRFGPPPEALREPARLPEGFLDTPAPVQAASTPAPAPGRPRVPIGVLAVGVVLALMCGVLLAFLLLG